MAFSDKQKIYLEYLLQRIGFTEPNLIEKYLDKLESIFGRYIEVQTQKSWYYKYSNSECIDELLQEIKLKEREYLIKLKEIDLNSRISASDLSSFNFCPVSYSLSKSFQIEYPTNEDKRLVGLNLHESLRLIDKKFPDDRSESDFFDYFLLQNERINKIKNCELIFSGHNNEKVYFYNDDNNFVGQPDYIFKDPNGQFFVVEEKFKYLSSYTNPDDFEYEKLLTHKEFVKKSFFSNHIVQLRSYMDFIREYPIKYGVLIYWYYDFYHDQPNVHSVSLKVVKNNDGKELLQKTMNELNYFRINKTIEFETAINPNKCAACSVNKYCAHKTNNLRNLKFPYNRYDLKLKRVEFPKELIKETPSDTDQGVIKK